MKKFILIALRVFAALLLLVVMAFVGMNFSPIYRFREPLPFNGRHIFNPYISLDTTIGWKKSNFHTHTRVDKGINECPEYPDVVWRDYREYGYDILAFSNHNALTVFPDGDTVRQIWVYEHGYNPLKFHKLVFGSEKVLWFDNMLPLLPSQKQFMFDLLSEEGDFLVFNHPDRTGGISSKDMERLTGYRMIEGFCGLPTDMRHWDEALSAGHYSFNLINDDCHDSGNPAKIAIRCSFLNTPFHDYQSVKQTLLSGCFYTMSIPDFADVDKSVKIKENHSLPSVKWVGMKGDTVSISLSQPARLIKFTGQNGNLKSFVSDSESAYYLFGDNDTYIRITVEFENGIKIYTNPFARHLYEELGEEELFAPTPHPYRWGATIAFNLMLLILMAGIGYCIKRLLIRRHS